MTAEDRYMEIAETLDEWPEDEQLYAAYYALRKVEDIIIENHYDDQGDNRKLAIKTLAAICDVSMFLSYEIHSGEKEVKDDLDEFFMIGRYNVTFYKATNIDNYTKKEYHMLNIEKFQTNKLVGRKTIYIEVLNGNTYKSLWQHLHTEKFVEEIMNGLFVKDGGRFKWNDKLDQLSSM